MGTFSPKQLCDLVKKRAFLTQKTRFHDFSASQPSSSPKNEQNITLKLRQNSGETDLVTLIHQNMPKIGCFGAFSRFENCEPIICFFIPTMWNEISQMTEMPKVYITRNFQVWPKTKLSSLQWFEFLWQIPFVNIAIIPPFKARWGGWRGGSFDINTLFS